MSNSPYCSLSCYTLKDIDVKLLNEMLHARRDAGLNQLPLKNMRVQLVAIWILSLFIMML